MAFSTASKTIPVRHALRFDEDSLLKYLKRNVYGIPQTATLEVKQFGHGQSNPTFLLELLDGKNRKRYVLRKKPPGRILKSAHAVEREYQVLEALGKCSAVPVPQVICLCTDPSVIGTPFYVMNHVEGRIFTDPNLPDLSAKERSQAYQEMASVLSALHLVDVKLAGLEKYGRRDNYCKRQVETWARQYAASTGQGGPEPDPSMISIIDWLRKNIPAEDSQASNETTGIVHGDFRLDNLVYHPTEIKVIAVLDWELSTLGNRMSDAAYCCMPYRLPAGFPQVPALVYKAGRVAPGIPSEAEFVAKYCQETGSPWPASTWKFYVALSFFRAAAIFSGVYRRALQGNASSSSAIKTGALVGELSRIALNLVREEAALPLQPPPLVSRQLLYANTVSSSITEGSQGFEPTQRVRDLKQRLRAFMERHVYPNEAVLNAHAASEHRWTIHPAMEDMKKKAKQEGLWNLFIPADSVANASALLSAASPEAAGEVNLVGAGLSNLEYAPLCEIMGRSVWAPEVFNCNAPDTGNMEVLFRYGTPEQQRQWLLPLLTGSIRSCFAMTEPDVASSDATNIESSIIRDGDEYVLSGHKWWTSGAMDPRCHVAIFMGKTDVSAPPHRQQSMILVSMSSPGVRIVRPLQVFGFDDAPHGHAEVIFDNVRVPASNLLLGEGRGFEIAQGRLGPGRLHHCMRLIGAAERSIELMVQRAATRKVFGRALAKHGSFATDLAQCRMELEAARLLVLNAAHQLDLHGNKVARTAIAIAKVYAPRAALKIIDVAIQVHGGAGVSSDFPLAHLWATARTLRLADGPDEVHLGTIAKDELKARL